MCRISISTRWVITDESPCISVFMASIPSSRSVYFSFKKFIKNESFREKERGKTFSTKASYLPVASLLVLKLYASNCANVF